MKPCAHLLKLFFESFNTCKPPVRRLSSAELYSGSNESLYVISQSKIGEGDTTLFGRSNNCDQRHMGHRICHPVPRLHREIGGKADESPARSTAGPLPVLPSLLHCPR